MGFLEAYDFAFDAMRNVHLRFRYGVGHWVITGILPTRINHVGGGDYGWMEWRGPCQLLFRQLA